MVDLYSFDSILVTPLLEKSVDHLLSEDVRDSVSKKLISELEQWKESDNGRDLQSNVDLDTEGSKVMSFDLLKKIQEQLKSNPLDGRSPFIADLMKGTRIVFPRYHPPPRNPELVARLEKIKKDLENEEYDRMVGKINERTNVLQDIRLDAQEAHRQLWMVFNFLFTVVGSFVFGYFAAFYAGFELAWCYMTGLIFGLAVFFADLYFIAKHM